MKKFSIWPAGIFVLLGVNVAVVATTIALATSTDSAVVESRPYEKGLNWDREQRHRAASKELGWDCKVSLVAASEGSKEVLVRASFRGAQGAPIVGLNVSASTFHHAHAVDRRSIDLVAIMDQPGEYVGTVAWNSKVPIGMWRVVISADLATAVSDRRAFEQTTDLMLSFDAAGASPSK